MPQDWPDDAAATGWRFHGAKSFPPEIDERQMVLALI